MIVASSYVYIHFISNHHHKSLAHQHLFEMDEVLQLIQQEDEEDFKIKPKTGSVQWREMLLKQSVIKAINQYGYQRPSQIQTKGIPEALAGKDLICQAKSGTGKTAVFVISILTMISVETNGQNKGFYNPHQCIVMAHTRELAHQIFKQFRRFSRYIVNPPLRIGCYFGGIRLEDNLRQITNKDLTPHIIVGTPGRLCELVYNGYIRTANLKFLIVDQCDNIMNSSRMRGDFERILGRSPKEKQIMMFSATLHEQTKKICARYMNNPSIICVDEGKLTLRGVHQFFTRIEEAKKFEKLMHLLDTVSFNQVIIFANKIERVKKICSMLKMKFFNPICIHSQLKQEERIKNYDLFKEGGSKLLVATDLFGRGIDIQSVNFVINYDFPYDRHTYLHRAGRAGRFNTKALVINFIRAKPQGEQEARIFQEEQLDIKGDDLLLEQVQDGFQIKIEELPLYLNTDLYM